jgi:hypothetical protein
MTQPNLVHEAEQKLDEAFETVKTELTPNQRRAIKDYKTITSYLGIDTINDAQNPVLSPDKIITDSGYLCLTADQLMYYIGVLNGLRPYLGEQLVDNKARAFYSTIWKKFNEVGFKVNFRKDRLREELEKIEAKILVDALKEEVKEKGKKAINLAVKKSYTEDNLKDEASYRAYTWSKIEGEKLRKAELLNFYVTSVDNLIVTLKERVRYMNPEKWQAKYGDNANSLMP